MQYKLTRDRKAFSENLEERMNTNWSQFKNKQELSDYFSEVRNESMEEREMVRTMVRNRISRDNVAKTMYEINRQPWRRERWSGLWSGTGSAETTWQRPCMRLIGNHGGERDGQDYGQEPDQQRQRGKD